MFRLIPFTGMRGIDVRSTPKELYMQACTSNNVFIQDTDDMKIEAYSPDELKRFEKTNKNIKYVGFSYIDPMYNDPISFNEMSYDIHKETFLNGGLKIRTASSMNYHEECFLKFSEDDSFSTYYCYLGYRNNSFMLDITRAESDDGSEECILFVNNTPLYHLTKIASEDVYFELIQVCKTKKGFDVVFYFCDRYFGISLDSDLNVLSFHNLEAYNCKRIPNGVF